jgi:hypothetical protein
MPQHAATPPLAQGRDGTVYLVLDDFGELGSAYRETDAAKADLATVVADLLSGQYRYPLRVAALNTAEGLWSSNHFVIYYRDGRVPQPGIIPLGRVTDDVSIFDRPGPVTVRVERIK